MKSKRIQIIVLILIITAAFVIGIIVMNKGKHTEPSQSQTEIELTAEMTSNHKVIEIPTQTTQSAKRAESSDHRVFADESGGIHIDVGATADSVVANTPHISGNVFVSTETEGDDAD
ncbi:MAG: hypothetical protein IJQ37_00525 [Clostridia bacterium]|nr:hypothetical protein [Clostridia bacterium]